MVSNPKNIDRTPQFLALLADYIAKILPPDDAEAAEVLRLVAAKRAPRKGLPRFVGGLIAASLVATLTLTVDDELDRLADLRPRIEARLVERTDGQINVYIVRAQHGKPSKVLRAEVITAADAKGMLESPQLAVQAFPPPPL